MPHAELKYSADLTIDAAAILADIEQVILKHDSGSGDCKGRAYPSQTFHHTHLLVSVAMLTKPHRDEAFTEKLIADLERSIKTHLHQRCFFSLDLRYMGGSYITNLHDPES